MTICKSYSMQTHFDQMCIILYRSVLHKLPWALKHNSQFWPALGTYLGYKLHMFVEAVTLGLRLFAGTNFSGFRK